MAKRSDALQYPIAAQHTFFLVIASTPYYAFV